MSSRSCSPDHAHDQAFPRARVCFTAVAAVASLLITAPASPQTDWAAVRSTAEAARAAHDRQDWPAFLEQSRRLQVLRPRNSRALYMLASALSRTGNATEAVRSLEQIADWGVSFEVGSDPDLQPLAARPDFQAVEERMKALRQPLGDAVAAITLSEPDLIPEAVVHDPLTGSFFVSSVHRRKVVRIGKDGTFADFVAERQDGLLAATALAICQETRGLFVATRGEPQMLGYRPGDDGSFVFEYDIDRGSLRRKLGPPASEGTLSDLACGPDGSLYASDPDSGQVYRLRPGAERFEVLVPKGRLVSAQGLAPTPDGRHLFVADYALGVLRIDLPGGELVPITGPDNLLMGGIDGLAWAGDSLVAIQNGLEPHRVLRLRLDGNRAAIIEASLLARAHPQFDEPTLGTVVGDSFYFVANSQYRFFADDGTLKREGLRPPVVLRLRLPWVVI